MTITPDDAREALASIQTAETNFVALNLRLNALAALTVGGWNSGFLALLQATLLERLLEQIGLWATVLFLLVGFYFVHQVNKVVNAPLLKRYSYSLAVLPLAALLIVAVFAFIRGVLPGSLGNAALPLYGFWLLQGMMLLILLYCGRIYGLIAGATFAAIVLVEVHVPLIGERLNWLAAIGMLQAIPGFLIVWWNRQR